MSRSHTCTDAWAVVALKCPQRAKTRLAAVLDAEQRRCLLFALAERVVGALQATRRLDQVAVATASPQVAGFARALGAMPIVLPDDAGTAAAFGAAIETLGPLKPASLLMIAGDLPLITPAAVNSLIDAAAAGPGVTLVPDRHRLGTNALLCTPPRALAPHFGEDSFRRHLAAAATAGVTARVVEIDELALDLDTAADLDELRRVADPYAAALLESLRDIAHQPPTITIRPGAAPLELSR